MLRIVGFFAIVAVALGISPSAHAGAYKTAHWPDLKAEIFGTAELRDGAGIAKVTAPYRSSNDAEVPVQIDAGFPDGRMIRSISIIIDENPMPVSAVFRFDEPRKSVSLAANMRLNGPTPVRAVVEDLNGDLYMTWADVKTMGQGTCSAAPVGDPEAALASIGQMKLFDQSPVTAYTPSMRRARLEMKHPQHTGLQMDQITLHYILPRFIDTVEVFAGDQRLVSIEGSISISEDPEIEFDFPNTGTDTLRVRMTDTSDTVVERELQLLPNS